jgi:hypothetical protein
MKTQRLFLMVILVFFSTVLFAQEVKKEAEAVKTKMDLFSSKTGTITKFVDTKLPNLKTSYGGAENRIRKISNGVTSAYFYQIKKDGKYSNSTASIEYTDLLEVLKALNVLKVEVEKDIATNPDYLENKFVTVDGFQVGYYVSSSKATWYLKLEKYGSENTLFIDSSATIENAFTEAKNKIDELKK